MSSFVKGFPYALVCSEGELHQIPAILFGFEPIRITHAQLLVRLDYLGSLMPLICKMHMYKLHGYGACLIALAIN